MLVCVEQTWVQINKIIQILFAFALVFLECQEGLSLHFCYYAIGSVVPGKLNQDQIKTYIFKLYLNPGMWLCSVQ